MDWSPPGRSFGSTRMGAGAGAATASEKKVGANRNWWPNGKRADGILLDSEKRPAPFHAICPWEDPKSPLLPLPAAAANTAGHSARDRRRKQLGLSLVLLLLLVLLINIIALDVKILTKQVRFEDVSSCDASAPCHLA
jgi:hypothetical protein